MNDLFREASLIDIGLATVAVAFLINWFFTEPLETDGLKARLLKRGE